jgi:hypothetical protein
MVTSREQGLGHFIIISKNSALSEDRIGSLLAPKVVGI